MAEVLDSDTAIRALFIITSPPDTEKLKAIKTFLISAFELSECERALFNLPGLSDLKPLELMNVMLSLLGTHKPCFLFKLLFLQQLADYVPAPLATSTLTDYRTLAQDADQIYLSGHHHPENTIQEVNATGYKSNKVPPPSTSNLCWYHHRFGKSAKKCLPHCKHYDNYNRNQNQVNWQWDQR